MSRPELTLIVVLEDRMIRGDYQFVAGGKNADQGLPQCVNLISEHIDLDELRTTVETALFMGGEIGKRTIVLSTDVISRHLLVPAHALAKLKSDELQTALTFEAETVVDMPAEETVIGFQLLDDGIDRRYWVQALDSESVTSIAFAVERAGSKLIGIGHPGGLPISFAQLDDAIENYSENENFDYWGAASSSGDVSPWNRVEKWPGMIVGARGGHRRTSDDYDVELLEVDPQSLNWRSALRHFFDDATESGVLEASAAVVMAEVDMQSDFLDDDSEGPRDDDWFSGVVQRKTQSTERLCCADRHFHELDEKRRWRSLTNEDSMELFLTAWAFTAQTMSNKATADQFQMPLIKAPKRPVTARQLSWLGVACLVLAVAGCFVHWQLQQKQIKALNDKIAIHKKQSADIKKMDDALKTKRDKIAKMEVALSDLRETVNQRSRLMTVGRAKWQMLLTFIARAAPENLYVSKIKSNHRHQVILTGICLEPELANQMANDLQQSLPKLGWQVQPPEKKSMNLNGQGAPYLFDLTLNPVPLPTQQQSKAVASSPALAKEGGR